MYVFVSYTRVYIYYTHAYICIQFICTNIWDLMEILLSVCVEKRERITSPIRCSAIEIVCQCGYVDLQALDHIGLLLLQVFKEFER